MHATQHPKHENKNSEEEAVCLPLVSSLVFLAAFLSESIVNFTKKTTVRMNDPNATVPKWEIKPQLKLVEIGDPRFFLSLAKYQIEATADSTKFPRLSMKNEVQI